ncbi:hypothetical protein Tco_1217143 [Tanacetum coccineum]
MSPGIVARDRNSIKKWIWSKTLSQKVINKKTRAATPQPPQSSPPRQNPPPPPHNLPPPLPPLTTEPTTSTTRAHLKAENEPRGVTSRERAEPATEVYELRLMESSATREYPSLIHTFFVTHTVGGVFVRDEGRALYDEMLRLQRLGSNTEMGVPYTEEEIMTIV